MAFDLRLLGLGQPRRLGFAQVSGAEAHLAQRFIGIGGQVAFGRGRRGIIEVIGHADRVADQVAADGHGAQRDRAFLGHDAAVLAEDAVLRKHRVIIHGVVHVVALRRGKGDVLLHGADLVAPGGEADLRHGGDKIIPLLAEVFTVGVLIGQKHHVRRFGAAVLLQIHADERRVGLAAEGADLLREP